LVQLTLNQEEAELLQSTLESCLSELRTEIAHTDRRDYREMLRRQQTRLKSLLQQLEREGESSKVLAVA